MALVTEELVLFGLVLVALGALALGLVELMWPRARRAWPARRPVAGRRAAPPAPPIPEPPPRLIVPGASPSLPMSVEELLEQAMCLVDFPLRALVLLHRADEQLGRLSVESARVEALQQRLTAAHAAVGCRLVAAGLAEQAVAPLTRVVSRTTLDGEEARRAREALASALGDIAEQRGLAIRRLARDGNTAAAITHGDQLLALLRGALDSGLTETELAGALASAQRVFTHLGVRRVVVAR